MGFGFRIYFVEEGDKIERIPATRFDRIRNRDLKEILPKFKNSRVRYAMVMLEFENRKPVSIVQIDYGYLVFDFEGRVDQQFLDTEGHVAISMLPSIPLPGEPSNVVQASDRFAKKRFKDEFTWTPSFELEQAIIKKAFD
jgi:hypothetical protein